MLITGVHCICISKNSLRAYNLRSGNWLITGGICIYITHSRTTTDLFVPSSYQFHGHAGGVQQVPGNCQVIAMRLPATGNRLGTPGYPHGVTRQLPCSHQAIARTTEAFAGLKLVNTSSCRWECSYKELLVK